MRDKLKFIGSELVAIAVLAVLWGGLQRKAASESAGESHVRTEARVGLQSLQADQAGAGLGALASAPGQDSREQGLAQRFREYAKVSAKTLKSAEEMHAHQAMLSDPEMIRSSVDYLLSTRTNLSAMDYRSERLDRLNYLMQALRWERNPTRRELVQSIERIVLEARADADASEETRRNLVGDRIELIMALAHDEPARAQELLKRSEADESTHKLVQYAIGFYERQKQEGRVR